LTEQRMHMVGCHSSPIVKNSSAGTAAATAVSLEPAID
jgi:hypothetical protein